MNQSETSQRVRFEEVSPANTGAAFLDASIESLVVPLGLPIYDGYDGLDDLQLTFLTLPSSGETVTLASYLNSPQPGTSIHIDSAMQNIPQVIFESCQQLQVSREEVLWFHPDWQEEIDRLYAQNRSIQKRPKLSQVEEFPSPSQYEPIDCFNHALRIYTKEYIPASYWAMLQHNLGLAYFNRVKGDRKENLERSIECFNKSLVIFTHDKFPDKWKINLDELRESRRYLKKTLVKDLLYGAPYQNLKGADLSHTILSGVNLRKVNLSNSNLIGIDLSGANLSRANLSHTIFSGADLSVADLSFADLSGANLSRANICGTNLSHAKLSGAGLSGANLSHAKLSGADLSDAILSGASLNYIALNEANVKNARFGYNPEISESLKQDLTIRGAIFDDPPGDRSESKILVPC